MKKAPFLFIISFLYFLLTGCSQTEPETITKGIRPVKMSTTGSQQTIDQDDANKAKNILLRKDQVKLVRSVQSKDLLIAAVELDHWNTFKFKSLTNEMKKTLEKEIKIKNVEVTTDHKIFIELEKLEQKVINDNISEKKLDKELKQISKLMKEQT
ncbi:MAG TPA: hypothetical protein GXX18_18140 [Bacillales bacterium]|nr:hypothetical protein [Bacillales bacterium]